jgi:hypothetical protein
LKAVVDAEESTGAIVRESIYTARFR